MKTIQERRAEAVAKNLCGTCCTREPSEGNRTCDDCIAQANARGARLRRGWCLNCIAFGFHREECRP